MQQQQQQQQQQQKVSGWGNVGKSSGNTKSLLEIQHEEARQMEKMQQQVGHSRPPNITLPATPAPSVSTIALKLQDIESCMHSSRRYLLCLTFSNNDVAQGSFFNAESSNSKPRS